MRAGIYMLFPLVGWKKVLFLGKKGWKKGLFYQKEAGILFLSPLDTLLYNSLYLCKVEKVSVSYSPGSA